ncbi:hypothetical protein GCM10022200_15920 [Microbacterium awajiense]|uniref:Uncharacterized protein n=1 Tax=Microbacterium awajiense TaxID=415214 RepID=A0ABP7AJB4_9MICO
MRAPRRMLVAGGVVAIALALTGCGDMQPEDLNDLFDQAREAIDEVQEAVEDTQPDQGDPEYEEGMREARDDWDTYQQPPPDIEPLDDDPYAFHSTDGDGQQSATEEYHYDGEHEDELSDWYSREYGSEPTSNADGTEQTWEDGGSKTTVKRNFDGTVSARTTWYKP